MPLTLEVQSVFPHVAEPLVRLVKPHMNDARLGQAVANYVYNHDPANFQKTLKSFHGPDLDVEIRNHEDIIIRADGKTILLVLQHGPALQNSTVNVRVDFNLWWEPNPAKSWQTLFVFLPNYANSLRSAGFTFFLEGKTYRHTASRAMLYILEAAHECKGTLNAHPHIQADHLQDQGDDFLPLVNALRSL